MPGHNFLKWSLDLGWLLFLFILLKHFWQDRKALLRAQSWLKTKGHIVTYELNTVGQTAWPKIEYSYWVHDRELTGEHLFLDTSHNNPYSKYSRQIAYKAAMAFKENAEIEIYYNPNHPEQSALDITMPFKLDIILILIGFLIILHLGVITYRFI